MSVVHALGPGHHQLPGPHLITKFIEGQHICLVLHVSQHQKTQSDITLLFNVQVCTTSVQIVFCPFITSHPLLFYIFSLRQYSCFKMNRIGGFKGFIQPLFYVVLFPSGSFTPHTLTVETVVLEHNLFFFQYFSVFGKIVNDISKI